METRVCKLRGLNSGDGGHGLWDCHRSVFPASHRTQRIINNIQLYISDCPWIYCAYVMRTICLLFRTQKPIFVLDFPFPFLQRGFIWMAKHPPSVFFLPFFLTGRGIYILNSDNPCRISFQNKGPTISQNRLPWQMGWIWLKSLT